jgi:hypothetical protein
MLEEIAEHIQEGKIKIVSNGSYIENKRAGTLASIIAINKNKYLCVQHMISGESSIQGSPQNKLSGIMGAMLIIQEICRIYNIGENEIELRCDRLGQIKIMNNIHRSTSNSRKHFDLIEVIRKLVDDGNTNWTFKHVKGHQDRFARNQELDIWAKLNIIADDEAKKKVTQICRFPQLLEKRPTALPYEKCRVYICTDRGQKRNKISSQLSKTGKTEIHRQRIRKYWIRKMKINNYNAQFVDWEVGVKSCKKLNKSRQKWLAKCNTGICGVGKQLKQWKHQDHDKCLRCEQDGEDVIHIMQCQHPSASIVWVDAMEKMEAWMNTNH